LSTSCNRYPDAKAVGEAHPRVRERLDAFISRLLGHVAARKLRTVVAARPVFARPLEAEFVGQRIRELRVQRPVDRVREVLLDTVRAQPPGVDVERAVHLFGERVVVLQRSTVVVRQVEIELGDDGPVVVRTRDRAELVLEQARPLGLQEVVELRELRLGEVARPILLLRLVANLLVVGEEEERLVTHDRPAEGEAELVAVELRLAAAP
jgi:hypothetical protein